MESCRSKGQPPQGLAISVQGAAASCCSHCRPAPHLGLVAHDGDVHVQVGADGVAVGLQVAQALRPWGTGCTLSTTWKRAQLAPSQRAACTLSRGGCRVECPLQRFCLQGCDPQSPSPTSAGCLSWERYVDATFTPKSKSWLPGDRGRPAPEARSASRAGMNSVLAMTPRQRSKRLLLGEWLQALPGRLVQVADEDAGLSRAVRARHGLTHRRSWHRASAGS